MPVASALMSNLAFYREQAAARQSDADAATLDNVRARNQRAADAWTALADRLIFADTLRAERIAELPLPAAAAKPPTP